LLTLVALFYVTQNLSAIAHLALVRHVVCFEHGELVDVEAWSSAVPASKGSPSSELDSQKSSSHSDHGHEHCGVLAHFRPHLFAPVFAGIPVRTGAVPDVAIVCRESSPALAIPIYQLAPKNSPPA